MDAACDDAQSRPHKDCNSKVSWCNGTTKAKQKRSTENAEPHVGCTNKPGDVQGEWSAIGTCALGLFAHTAHPPLQRGGGYLVGQIEVSMCGGMISYGALTYFDPSQRLLTPLTPPS